MPDMGECDGYNPDACETCGTDRKGCLTCAQRELMEALRVQAEGTKHLIDNLRTQIARLNKLAADAGLERDALRVQLAEARYTIGTLQKPRLRDRLRGWWQRRQWDDDAEV